MKITPLAESQTYFEISNHILRQETLKTFLEILAALPFALLWKLWITLLKTIGVIFAVSFLLVSLGMSRGIRDLFVKRAAACAANLADWVIMPFAMAVCFSKLLLGWILRPLFRA